MIFSPLLDFLLPTICPACRQQAGQYICENCIDELPNLANPCPYCASERPEGMTSCGQCHDAGLRGLREITCIGSYGGNLERLINDAKAGSRPAAVAALAQLAANEHAMVEGIDMIVPIPPNPAGERAVTSPQPVPKPLRKNITFN